MKQKLVIRQNDKAVYEKDVDLKVLQLFSDSVSISSGDNIEVMLGDHVMEYRTDPSDGVLSRPLEAPKDFDWNSVQGLFLEGKEFIRERQYVKAEEKLQRCLSKDPHFLPALTNLAMVHYRNMEYQKAMLLLTHALSIDTYDPMANFYYGLTSAAQGKMTDARDGFDLASMSPEYRVAATTELSRMDLKTGKLDKAIHYANKSLEGNGGNVEALQLLAVSYRLQGDSRKAAEIRKWIKDLNPLNHFAAFEDYVTKQTPELRAAFATGIRNELTVETYLELAAWYYRLDRLQEIRLLLEFAPANAEVMYWQAWLDQQMTGSSDKSLERATAASVLGVFPFRAESSEILQWATGATTHWKPKYLLGLIFWSKNQISKARELLVACGDTPDFAPLYAARAQMRNDHSLTDLQKASVLDPKQWRYGKMLIQHYFVEKNFVEGLRVAKEYDARIPGDFRIRLLLAKAQLLNDNYKGCNEVLAKTYVLPYEGSTEGHALFREAWLLQAVEQIKALKYSAALGMIAKARTYPPNLGVGKPYDADIDSRAEYFLEGLCYEGMKKNDKAKVAWNQITSQTQWPEGINTLVTAWAFRKTGAAEKGESILRVWTDESHKVSLADWCLETYRKKSVALPVSSEADGTRLIQAIYSLNP
jgi:tetratricopeptide (TPR) repeat protein